MVNKKSIVSINAFENSFKDKRHPDVSTISWNGLNINVKYVISFSEMVQVVEMIADSCFTDDGVYVPQAEKYAFQSTIIRHYTNISLPSNNDHAYSMIVLSDIFDVVSKEICSAQLAQIEESTRIKIEYLRDSNINEVRNRLNALVNTFELMNEKVSESASMLTPEAIDDMRMLASTLSNKDVSADSIVEAYMRHAHYDDKGNDDDE